MYMLRDGRILFLIKVLVALIFLSKVSFGSLLPVPRNFSFLIFQQGMHPFLNVLFCFLFGLPLVLLGLKERSRNHLSGFYKLFVVFLAVVLTIQTLLQIHYVNTEESLILQVGALAVSLFMILIYGVSIPSLWNIEDFVQYVQRWSGALVCLSLLLWLVGVSGVFKGGRFIGVFKHIPHMVTCATVGFIFSLGTFIQSKKMKHKIWSAFVLVASFFAIILTGTRSSAAAAMVAFFVTLILHQTKTNQGRLFKFGFVSFAIMASVFFGGTAFEFTYGLATGQNSLGSREAQNGVESRWEEIERGAQIFLQQPWLGHGLVSKFASGNEVDVSNYNAMKDPHNIFVSAGVVGGWPLLFLSVISLALMAIGSMKAVLSENILKRQVAIYLLSHISILVIYHIHLSVGGMADRIYWLVFGFVAASSVQLKQPS